MSSEEEKPYDLLADYLSPVAKTQRYHVSKSIGVKGHSNNKRAPFSYGTILDEIVVKTGRGSMPYTAKHPSYTLVGSAYSPAKAVQHLLIQIASLHVNKPSAKPEKLSLGWGAKTCATTTTPFNRETMILVKGQSCHFNGQEHTIIETNYLGLRLSSDETGETVFIKASDADKVLLMIESEPKIKAVEVKLPPLSEHTRNVNYLRGANVKDLQHGRDWFLRGQMAKQTPEQVKMREAARLAGAIASRKSPKQETPIEEIRERSKETSIRDSSRDKERTKA